MKKLLILGVNGFIGHHLSEAVMRATDWDVYGMDLECDRLARHLHLNLPSRLGRKERPPVIRNRH